MFANYRRCCLQILFRKPQMDLNLCSCSVALPFCNMDRSSFNKDKKKFSSRSTEHTEFPQLKSTEEESILKFFNTCTIKDLKNMGVFSTKEVTDIMKYRRNNGTFSTFSSISALTDVDIDRLQSLYTEVVSVSKTKTNIDNLKKYFTPTLFLKDIQKFSSVTSLLVCLDSICFARLTRDLDLSSWDHQSYDHFKYKQQRLTDIFELAHNLVKHIPKSDIYLVEEYEMKSKNNTVFNVLQYLFINQLKMSLLHLLNEDFKSGGQHKVFFVKPFFVKKTFELMVGGEGVSGQFLLTNLENNEVLKGLDISSQQMERFANLGDSGLQRERYTQALLLSLGFFKLID